MTGQAALADDRPRYQRIADDLRARIEAGAHPVGTLLPTEAELCAEFDTSRHTVREALRRLAEAGLIQRRQGSGSLVTAQRAAPSYVHQMRSVAELFQYAADTRFRIGTLTLARPGAEDAADLGPEGAGDWLMAEGLRLEQAQDVPICFSRVYVNRAFAAIAPELPGLPGAIYARIEARFGVEVAEVVQVIRAVPLPADAAAALGRKPREAGVRVVRRYLDGEGGLMLASVNFHPAERFSYTMRLRREGPRGGWG